MARRSDHSRAELTALLLASARRFAEAEGLSGIAARRIARDVGYAPGTIYHVFGSLDRLILRLCGEVLDELHAHCAAVQLGANAAANLRRLADAYAGFVLAHPRLWSVVFEHRPEGGVAPDWYGEKIRRLLGFAEQATAGLFAPGEEALRQHEARVLWSSLHGIVSLEVAGKMGEGATVASLTRSLIENYVRALEVRRPGLAPGQAG